METNLKKLEAVAFAEERPFFIGHFDDCFCIFGNPSGHMSGYISFHFFIIYYYFVNQRISKLLTVLVFLIAIFLGIILAMSRFYFAAHHINHILNGIF